MAYILAADLKTYVAAQLRQASDSEMAAPFDVIYPRAINFAHGEIINAMTGQGYTVAQIDQWDRRVEYSLDLACWFCLRNAASLQADKTWVEMFDRRKELSDHPVALTINSVPQDPTFSRSMIRTGRMASFDDLDETLVGGDEV